jgi:hypothetical protein
MFIQKVNLIKKWLSKYKINIVIYLFFNKYKILIFLIFRFINLKYIKDIITHELLPKCR